MSTTTPGGNDEGPTPRGLSRGEGIGRYVVLGLVGRGAMGEVYAAYDPELDRKVAVKLLRAQAGATDLTATEAKSRLLREAQAIARLSHPNVIVVHDVGSFGDRVFIAMEFVDGYTIGYWLLAQKRSWKEVLKVFAAAGQGLAAAHASQLVHRDFKADNVMLGRDGKVRVMDFGLARRVAAATDDPAAVGARGSGPVTGTNTIALLESADLDVTATRILPPSDSTKRRSHAGARERTPPPADTINRRLESSASSPPTHLLHPGLSTNLTQTGAILGTPAYMAPEQLDGKSADERSDQFSFCVALYEGLYREHPFDATTAAGLFDKVRRGQFRTAPERTRVPTWLRRVVVRGLRVNPADRWPSMDALLAALHDDPVVKWRRVAIVAAATAGIVGIGIAARRQGARESQVTCRASNERFAHVWEPRAAAGSRRAAIAAAFKGSGQANAETAFAETASVLDRYVSDWSSLYSDNCEATTVRKQQTAEDFDLRARCLGDRWNEMRALSDVLADPSPEVVENAVEAAAALIPPERCADVDALRAAVSHSVALWKTPGTMSLVAPRAHPPNGKAPARREGETQEAVGGGRTPGTPGMAGSGGSPARQKP